MQFFSGITKILQIWNKIISNYAVFKHFFTLILNIKINLILLFFLKSCFMLIAWKTNRDVIRSSDLHTFILYTNGDIIDYFLYIYKWSRCFHFKSLTLFNLHEKSKDFSTFFFDPFLILLIYCLVKVLFWSYEMFLDLV